MLVLRRGENRSTRKKNLSEQGREPATNSAHICHRDRESNPGHNGGRRALSPLRHPCSPVMHVLPRLAPVACFPALGTPPVAYFPALGTSCMLSSAWHQLHAFQCLAPVACFPVLGTGCMHVFPRSAPVACVVARTWHRLHVFPLLATVARFSTLGTGCVFHTNGIGFCSDFTTVLKK